MKRIAAAVFLAAFAAAIAVASDLNRETAVSAGGAGAEPPSVGTSPDGGPSARRTTPIAPTPFMGYPEAYVLHSDRFHAVVVPAISRLVFLAASADAPNLLRLDPALAEAGALPPDPATAPGFFDIGGDWVWPVARSNWPAITVDGHPWGRDWPPPPPLADGPSAVEAWRDQSGNQHVVLTRSYPAPVCATLQREFFVAASGSLGCKQTLRYTGPVEETGRTILPLALWQVSQVVFPKTIYFSLPSADFTPTVLSGNLPDGALSVKTGNMWSFAGAIYTPPPSSKVGLSLPVPNLSAMTPNGFFLVDASSPTHAELHADTGRGYAEFGTICDSSARLSDFPLSNTLHYGVLPAH